MKKWLILLILMIFLSACKKDERALIVGKIKSANQLATTEFTIDKVVFGSREKRLLGLVKLNEARFLAYSQAIIKTGIDLNKLRPDDILIDGKMIQLELPAVEVLNFSYPAERFRMDKEISDNAFLNKLSIEDYEYFFREAELDIRQNLQYLGLVETTEEKTIALMQKMLIMLGYSEIYISFKKGPVIEEVKLEAQEP